MCVAAFPLSTTRRQIFYGFLKIVDMLKQQAIPCEVLVDGSYLTDEIEPEDIDAAVVVTPEFYAQCKGEPRKLLDWIRDDKTIKQTHLTDCYLCVDYKQGHPEWFDGINDRAWWIALYAKSVVFKRVRGVAVVTLTPGAAQ